MTKAKFKPFTQEQLYYLAQGKIRSEQLTANVYYGLGIDTKIVSPKRHTYITSGPGAGKTYTVNAAIEKKKQAKYAQCAMRRNQATSYNYKDIHRIHKSQEWWTI
jgi:transcription initiation factor TFIID subunit TAF12